MVFNFDNFALFTLRSMRMIVFAPCNCWHHFDYNNEKKRSYLFLHYIVWDHPIVQMHKSCSNSLIGICVFIVWHLFNVSSSLQFVLCGVWVWTVRVPCAHSLGMLALVFSICLPPGLPWLYTGLEQSPLSVTIQSVHHCTILYHLFTCNIISYSTKQPSTITRD